MNFETRLWLSWQGQTKWYSPQARCSLPCSRMDLGTLYYHFFLSVWPFGGWRIATLAYKAPVSWPAFSCEVSATWSSEQFRAGHICSHISHVSALCWKCTLLSSFLILPTKFLIPLLCSRLDFVSSRKLFLTPGTGCETPSLSSHGTLTLIPSHPPHALWLSCLSSISRWAPWERGLGLVLLSLLPSQNLVCRDFK